MLTEMDPGDSAPERSLLVLGAGGHARVVAEVAHAYGGTAGFFERVTFLDDNPAHPGVIGPLERCREDGLRAGYGLAVVAIGQSHHRLSWLERLEELGYHCPPLIHPTAWVSPSAQLGSGTVVMPQAAVMAGAQLGRGCIVNTSASIDHDCVLADGVHCCPGSHLAGAVQVGARSWIGIGSSVIQGLTIGVDVTVGAGAAVVHDLVDEITAVGVPARALPT